MKKLVMCVFLSAISVIVSADTFRDKNGRTIGTSKKIGTYIQFYDKNGRSLGSQDSKGVLRDKNGRNIGSFKGKGNAFPMFLKSTKK